MPTDSTLNTLISLIMKIPGTFWGVIIGSFFTLLGIFLTNRAHDRRLQTQLAYDRDMKNLEREMSLRKDIYLTAAEAVYAGLIAVSRFANLDIPYDKLLEGYIDKAPSIAKTNIIVKEATVNALSNFSVELNAAFLRLFGKRFQLAAQKQRIELLRAQADTILKDNCQTLALIKQYNIAGQNDPEKWNVLQQNFKFEQNRFSEITTEADTLACTLYAGQLQYMDECTGEVIRLSRLLTPLLLSVRKELDLPIDEAEYLRIQEEAMTKLVASHEEFVQQLRSALLPQP